jgi:uncharacterized protein (DUF1015 family)
LTAVPDIRPFRALRYDEAVAGPLETLVAPPYDVISPEQREAYLARSPYNVVHLTLPDSEAEAARDLAAWRREGVLAAEEEPAVWWVAQEYVGPDGVERTREGFASSVRVEPYGTGAVLPHERTHAGPKEGRLRLLRATRTQLEPIFLLYDAEPPFRRPDRPPDLDVGEAGMTTRTWRMPDAEVRLDVPLLIADGHHRYETALAFRDEEPTATHTVAVLATLRALEHEPRNGAAAVLYRKGGAAVVRGGGELDTQLVESFAPAGVTYTPRADEAVARVDAGEAEAAFLLRPPALDDVWRVASRGEVMPQKTTYFFPKLVSGLLFHPL